MRICPNCSFRDGIHFRASTFDPTIDICRLEDVSLPELKEELTNSPRSTVITNSIYSYRRTKSDWVQRKETEFLLVEGWYVQLDGAGSRKSAIYKWRIRNPERYRDYQRNLMRKRRAKKNGV